MEKMTIEMPEKMKSFVDREISAGNFQTPSALFQSLVADLIRARVKKEIEQSLQEALDEYERGECTEWTKDDFQKIKADFVRRCQQPAKP